MIGRNARCGASEKRGSGSRTRAGHLDRAQPGARGADELGEIVRAEADGQPGPLGQGLWAAEEQPAFGARRP